MPATRRRPVRSTATRTFRNKHHAASAARKYARVAGKIRFKALIRQLPQDARDEITKAMRAAAPQALAIAQARAPKKSGRGANLLTTKVSGGKFPRLRIGLLTKRAQQEGFFLRILETGRKAGLAKATRRKPRGGVTRYFIRVKAIARGRYDFIWDSAERLLVDAVFDPINRAVDAVLRRVAGGGGNGD